MKPGSIPLTAALAVLEPIHTWLYASTTSTDLMMTSLSNLVLVYTALTAYVPLLHLQTLIFLPAPLASNSTQSLKPSSTHYPRMSMRAATI